MWKIILTVSIIVVIIAVVLIPYLKQPKITEETKKNFSVEKFYGESASGERAKIIPENGEALEERIRMIRRRRKRLFIYYDIKADISGKQVLAALLDAADRGVKVSIVTDGVPYVTSIWGNPYFLALAGQEM